MSEFHCIVVELGKIGHHPNADALDITDVFGYPVIVRRDQFKQGDLACYIPVDALVSVARPEFSFLRKTEKQEYHRVKAMRLRGIFSMGLLIPFPSFIPPGETLGIGDSIQEHFGIKKWEPEIQVNTGGEDEYCPFTFPKYTDIEGYRRYPNLIPMGTEVVVTEKIHGANGRYLYKDNELWVGSHNRIKRFDQKNMWWEVAIRYNLKEILSVFPDYIFFPEVYGQVQKGFAYDKTQDNPIKIRIFDIMDINNYQYKNWNEVEYACERLNIPTVPVLYKGPLTPEVLELRNGKSVLNPETIREGIVIKPLIELMDTHLGRRILKFVGEDYLLSKII